MTEHGRFCGCEGCNGFRAKLAEYRPQKPPVMKWAKCAKCGERVALIGYSSLGPLVLYCKVCAVDMQT